MHFVADENVPRASIRHLRATGHSVRAIVDDSRSVPDRRVLVIAVAERAVLVTFDRDFGELIYQHRAPAPLGLVYFRGRPRTPTAPAERLIHMSPERTDHRPFHGR